MTVLDVGAGTPESVRFFGRFQCSIYFADLYGETGGAAEPRQSCGPQETMFGRILDLPSDVNFDICLFWDFLNYLNVPLLRDLGMTLRRHVDAETRAHAFVAFSKALPFSGQHFGLEDSRRLIVRANSEPLPSQPHTHTAIARMFWPFQVNRAVLLGENRQELLLKVGRT